MRIGVVKEVKDKENRVAMVPGGVARLTGSGHQVLVESQAGEGAGFSDLLYKQAGAELVSVDQAWSTELVVKVKEPLESEYQYLNGQMLFTFFHLTGVNKSLTEYLLKKQVTALAYETLEDELGNLPILAPMSAVAGNMATLMGAYYLASFNQGRGVQLASILGAHSGKVLIIGDGVVGQHAAKVALAMGAEVLVAGLNEDKFKTLEANSLAGAQFVHSSKDEISRYLADIDLVVGAVLSRGAKAPKVLTEEMVKLMPTGAVAVDVSIDQGGCFETSRPTTHSHPVFIKHGVLHYCVTNMPGAFPRTATVALTETTIAYIEMIAENGIEVFYQNPGLRKAVNTFQGYITYEKVASDLNLVNCFRDITEII